MRLNSVDLPAPLGPMIQAICPFSTVRSTSCTATNPAKDFVIFSTRSSIVTSSCCAPQCCARQLPVWRGGTSAVLLTERLSDLSLPEVVIDEHGPQHDDHQTR